MAKNTTLLSALWQRASFYENKHPSCSEIVCLVFYTALRDSRQSKNNGLALLLKTILRH